MSPRPARKPAPASAPPPRPDAPSLLDRLNRRGRLMADDLDVLRALTAEPQTQEAIAASTAISVRRVIASLYRLTGLRLAERVDAGPRYLWAGLTVDAFLDRLVELIAKE